MVSIDIRPIAMTYIVHFLYFYKGKEDNLFQFSSSFRWDHECNVNHYQAVLVHISIDLVVKDKIGCKKMT